MGCEYLWQWFSRLNTVRPSGFSTGPVTETELRSFFLNRRIDPTPWEIDVLIRMDLATLSTKKPPDTEEEE